MTPDITVVSAFYNREDAVDMSVGSLVTQTCPSFRAVIVDDESRDGTFARLQAFASDRIEVRRQRNIGFTATMIALCAETTSEFIALHGAGDESLPNRLTAQLDFLRAHPGVVAVGCGIENVDEIAGRRWEVRPARILRPGPILGDFGISHGEVMFRRDAYLRVGGYRAAFTLGQASDLFRRMSRLGDFGYIEDVLYRRYLRPDGVSARIDKVAERTILAALSGVVHRRAVAADMGALRDDFDRYGLLLPYMGAADPEIARSLAQAAMLYWSAGETAIARRLSRRSLAETWTLRGWLALCGAHVGVGPLRRLLKAIAARFSHGGGEFSYRRLTGGGD